MHYNYHRYYDPSIGRYLKADPIGLAGGINLYVYSQNSPVNYIDPLGLEVLGSGMVQSFVPDVNPQEVGALASSGMLIGGGLAVTAGGGAIMGVGAYEVATIAVGNPAGYFGPHLMADGALMVGAGGFIFGEGVQLLLEYWDKYYEPPSNQNPCQ